MPNICDSFHGRYLKASDITDPVVTTIERIEYETVADGEDPKPVLYFTDSTNGLVLNRTNATLISAILKSELTEDWVGKQIGLRKEPVQFGSQTVPGIRCFDPTPPKVGTFGGKKPPPSSSNPENLVSDDEIPDPGAPIRSASRKR